MGLKKKLKKIGIGKLGNLVRIYVIDDSRTPDDWMKLLSKEFEEPDFECILVSDNIVAVVNNAILGRDEMEILINSLKLLLEKRAAVPVLEPVLVEGPKKAKKKKKGQ